MKRKRGNPKKNTKEKNLEENSEEAIEVNNIEEENGEEAMEESDGIDIENEMYDDYKNIPELDKYDKKVSELIDTKDLEKSLLKCPPKKRAEVYWTAAFGIYTNKYLELILDEKDPELHPIKKEMERLNNFRKKVVNADKIDEEIIENEVFNKRPEQLSVQEFVELTNLIGGNPVK